MKGVIGVIGSGAMGSGIAQVAAQAGHEVWLTDTNKEALERAETQLKSTFARLQEKGKMNEEEAAGILRRIHFTADLSALAPCTLVIEAIVENFSVKQQVFRELEPIVSDSCILGSNTSSLSITSIAGSCLHPHRVMGIHFFNPAPLMPLVEIIPGLQTSTALLEQVRALISSWQKVTVVCQDKPGFIVNRVARPFYGEALRILEEGVADVATIDAAMRAEGFKMGPFELMDLIGNDVNYAVTESVFHAFYFDPRYKPSITQKRLVEAGWLGRKTGKGFYPYGADVKPHQVNAHPSLLHSIANRIVAMLINEAYDALYLGVASAADLDLAMTKGVNYPKGLIEWGKELGMDRVRERMDQLYSIYQEDRYRPSRGIYMD